MRMFVRAMKVLSVITLFFFCWTFMPIYEAVAWAAMQQGQGAGGKFQTDNANTLIAGQQVSGERFEKALEHIRENIQKAEIKEAKNQDITAEVAEVKATRAEIDALDVELKKEFSATEKNLQDAGLPKEILDRHAKFVKHYENNLRELKANIDAVGKYTVGSKLGKEALRKAKLHLEKTKAPSKHVPLAPNNLPHRTMKAKERTPRLKKEEFEKEFGPQNLPGGPKTVDGRTATDVIAASEREWVRTNNSPILLAFNGPVSDMPLSLGSRDAGWDSAQGTPSSEISAIALNSSLSTFGLMFTEATAPPTSADLAETVEVQFTPAINAKAQELGYKPVKIYEWVRNNIDFVPTYGSIQGAEMCLQTKQCNAFDTSSLLIALLRASNISAKYVYGTVEVPIDKAMNWVGGFTNANAALRFISSGGIPAIGILSGGRLADVRMEHVWVDAWIDYSPSRGAVHKQGAAWIPLDASYKQYSYKKGLDLAAIIGFDSVSFIESLKTGAVIDPATGSATGVDSNIIQMKFSDMKTALKTHIESMQDPTVGDVLGAKDIIPEAFEILPASLQNKLILAGWKSSTLPDTLRHKVSISLTDPEWGDQILTATYATAYLAGKRFTLGYVPSSPSDAQAIKTLGYYNVRPYLINLKPVLYVDGAPSSLGSSVGMGQMQDMFVSFMAPRNEYDRVDHKFPAGTFAAIGLDLQRNTKANMDIQKAKFSETISRLGNQVVNADDVIGEALALHNTGYFHQVENANRMIARGKLAVTKQPAEMLCTLTPEITSLYGLPYGIAGQSMGVDVKRYVMTAASLSGASSEEIAFMRTSGAYSSAYEHMIFEQLHENSQGVSAIKILAIANQQKVPIYTIDSSNSSTLLARLRVSYETLSDVQAALAAGKQVVIPERSIQYNNWHGDGYIITDPETGAGAYMISGGLAGGGTSMKDEFLDALKEIFGENTTDYAEGVLKFLAIGSAQLIKAIKALGFLAAAIFAIFTGLEMYEKTGSTWKAWTAGVVDFLLNLAAGAYVGAIIFAAGSMTAAIVGILLVAMVAFLLKQLLMWIILNVRYFRPRHWQMAGVERVIMTYA